MKWMIRTLVMAFFLLSTTTAYAFDTQFVTYEGFSQTVSAFKVLSLIFNDNQFTVLAGVFAVIGIISGGFISFCRAVFAGGQTPSTAIGWLIMPFIGALVFQALVLPKGNIHVYDKVLNKHQTIGGIPNLLIIIAGSFNGLEYGLTRLVAKNTADPRARDVDPISFKLVYDAMLKTANNTDLGYQRSIKRFYKDCLPISMQVDKNFKLENLLKNTDDIFSELQHLWHPSVFTVFYGENRQGVTMSCTDCLNKLTTWGNNPVNFQEGLASICKRQGFDSQEQLPLCRKKLQQGANFIFNRSVNPDTLLRNSVFAYNIASTLQDMDPNVPISKLYNMRMINSGFATAMASQSWMPSIKATVTAVVLALTPFLLLFMATQFFYKAINILLSLFAWLAMWGICDAILTQSATDQMIAAFESVRSAKMGLWGLWGCPSAAIKALAIISQSRSTAMNIAAFLGAGIFGMNAYALSGMGGNLARRVEQEGVRAAEQVLEPDKNANYMDSLANASALYNTAANRGWGAVAGQKESDLSERVGRAQSMAPDGNYGDSGWQAGQIAGGEQRGKTSSFDDIARQNSQGLAQTAYRTSATETQQRVGGARGIEGAANHLDQGVLGMQQQLSETEMLKRTGQAATAEEIKQQIAEKNPEQSAAKSWRDLSMYESAAQAQGLVIGTDGKVTGWQSIVATQTKESIAATRARQATASSLGTTPEAMSADFATWGQLTQWEQNRAKEGAAFGLGMQPNEFAKAISRGGVVQNLVLTPEQLKIGAMRGGIPQHIHEMYKDTGVVVNGVMNPQGGFLDARYSANENATKTITRDTSLNLGTPASARQALTDITAVEMMYHNYDSDALYQASVSSLQGIVSMSHQDNVHANLDASASVGIGIKAIGGVKAGGSIGKNWSDQTVTDALYGNFSSFGKALEAQADQTGLTGDERIRFLATHYAQGNQAVQAHFMQDSTKDNVSLGAAKQFASESVKQAKNLVTPNAPPVVAANPFERYLQEHGLEKAREAFKAGVDVDKGEIK